LKYVLFPERYWATFAQYRKKQLGKIFSAWFLIQKIIKQFLEMRKSEDILYIDNLKNRNAILTKKREKKDTTVSWRMELVVTILMLGLVSFFAYWQIVDHVRLRKEQEKIITFLKKDISVALIGILNSQPRFGPIVLRESVGEKVINLMESGKGNPLNGIIFYNSHGKVLFETHKPGAPDKWYRMGGNLPFPYLKIEESYADIAHASGFTGNFPVIGNRDTVTALINLISPSPDEQLSEDLAPGGDQIGIKIKKILSDEYFQNKTVSTVTYLLDAGFLQKTISKDLFLRCVSLLFCLIAFSVFSYSLFNLNRNVKLKILLAQEQEKNLHFQEMHLVAAGLAHEIKNPLNLVRGTTQSIAELTDNPKEIKKKTKIVAEEVDRINTRINSFMAYSNLKSPIPKKISLKPILKDIIELLNVDIEEKDIEIKLELSDVEIMADEGTLRQVVFNLIHNSIKAINKGASPESEGFFPVPEPVGFLI